MGAHWTLFLLGSIYMIGELGHFLLGAASRSMAQDIHYGDKGCLKIPSLVHVKSDVCTNSFNQFDCEEATDTLGNGTTIPVCTWDYTGLGLEYHILAGPAFMAVFTVACLAWGFFADKYNRVHFLTAATLIFSCAIIGTALSTKYWHILLFRMALGVGESGCAPLASSIITDMFPKSQRGLALGLFHWGIYTGYGLSYTVGNYVTAANIFGQGWRASYVISGLPGLVLALVFFCTSKDPPRTKTELEIESDMKNMKDDNLNYTSSKQSLDTISSQNGSKVAIDKNEKYKVINNTTLKQGIKLGWNIVKNPAIVFLLMGACVRHAAGFCWGYNSALYFKTYYPDYDASLWLTLISIGAGATGVLFGGFLSDRLVSRLGISARALVLAMSQLLAAPFAFSIFFTEPPFALVMHFSAYVAAEMWFGVMFAILVELVPSDIRSKAVATALFFINNVGGNTPVIVDPIARLTSYRTAIILLYPGALITSSILFFVCWIILRSQRNSKS